MLFRLRHDQLLANAPLSVVAEQTEEFVEDSVQACMARLKALAQDEKSNPIVARSAIHQ